MYGGAEVMQHPHDAEIIVDPPVRRRNFGYGYVPKNWRTPFARCAQIKLEMKFQHTP